MILFEIVGIIGKVSMECNCIRCYFFVYVCCKKYIVDEDMFIYCFFGFVFRLNIMLLFKFNFVWLFVLVELLLIFKCVVLID